MQAIAAETLVIVSVLAELESQKRQACNQPPHRAGLLQGCFH